MQLIINKNIGLCVCVIFEFTFSIILWDVLQIQNICNKFSEIINDT